jgi:hypothetical protein
MRWLREHGVTATWRDYRDLPLPLLDDARLVMEAEHAARQIEAHRG